MFDVGVCVAVSAGLAAAADWLTVRGDQQHTGSQPDEAVLTVRTVNRLKLLWTQRFEADGALSDPIMLGPIITDRGVKELVFVRSSDTVYAVDADLGSIFWTRVVGAVRSGNRHSQTDCPETRVISPVIHWSSHEQIAVAAGEDHYSNGNRPLYALASDGLVHVLRSSTGGDLLLPFSLVPQALYASQLGEQNDALYALTSLACGAVADRVWSKKVGASGLKGGVATDAALSKHAAGLAIFEWNGSDWTIELGADGEPLLRRAASEQFLVQSAQGIATWKDKNSRRWIYTSRDNGIAAFLVETGAEGPVVAERWRLPGMPRSSAPIVSNGVVYFLSTAGAEGGNHLILCAVDAQNGAELFRSHEEISKGSSFGNLALANGHVCFSALKSSLQCFGLPFTM